MHKLATKHPAIENAYLGRDKDGDLIVVMETIAVLFADEPGFDQALRDSVEEVWMRLIHEHRCAGGKLLMVRR